MSGVLNNFFGDWHALLILLVAGVIPNQIWRMLGLVLGGGLDEGSEFLVWVRAVATAVLAGVIAQIVVQPIRTLANVPGGCTTICAMTPASTAVATALTHTRNSNPRRGPAQPRPSIRHIWFGMTPATSRISNACQSPRKLLRRRSCARSPPVNAIGNGTGGHAADEDVDAAIRHRRNRIAAKLRAPARPHGDLPGVACGGEQKRQRRQQEDGGGKQLRQIGRQQIADRGRGQADGYETGAEPMDKGDPPFARHLRQEAITFHPHRTAIKCATRMR